jgi:phosphatidylglycerophosphatase A
MSRVSRAAVLFLAQGAYSGRFPVAPGTAGTLVGVVLYLGLKDFSPVPYAAFCLMLCGAGIWAAGKAEEILGRKDSPSIVIDEIAGYLIAMFLVPSSFGLALAGFVLFRAFDILKPWPLNRLQDVRGGLGVMLDDVGAGIYANIALQVWMNYFSRG